MNRDKLITGRNLQKRFENLLAEENLSNRSKIFLTDVRNFFRKTGGLTPKMYACFEKAESRFSPETKFLEEQWKSEFDDEKRNLFCIVSEYYKHLGLYFNDVAKEFLGDKTFIPTCKQYDKMVNNKYAQKVIKSTLGKAKYEKSQLVQLRKTASVLSRGIERECLAVVLKPNSGPVTSDAKGAKKYQILPFGHSDPIEIEERYIKKFRGNLDGS